MRDLFNYEVKRHSLKFSNSLTEKYYSKKGNKVLEAEHYRDQYAGIFRSYDHSVRAQALAHALKNCDIGKRCRRIVCPVCRLAAEKYFKQQLEAATGAIFSSVCIPRLVSKEHRRYRESHKRLYAELWGNS